MGPFANTDSGNSSRPVETTTTVTETVNNIVTETAPATEQNGDSVMPDLIGKDFEMKKAQFEAEGWIYLEASYEYNDEFRAGQIVSQSIEKGKPFNSGATVQVVVSKGPSAVEIPEYEGKTLKQYEAELDALGLSEFYVTEAVTNYKYDNGDVIELNMEPGDMFEFKNPETLKIYYASNPETTTTTATTTTATTTTTAATTTTVPPTEAPTLPPETTAPPAPTEEQTQPPAETAAPVG
jgi:serine/threonine-protein kinase